MMGRENKNESLFMWISIGLAILSFVLYSLEDVAGFILLFFFILLVDIVCSIRIYFEIKNIGKKFTNLLKLMITVISNVMSYVFLILFVINIF